MKTTFLQESATSLTYAYDVLGRPITRTSATFGYNARSEVTNATLNAIDYTYAYDDIGNHTASSANSVSTIYDANALNQYTTISNLVQSWNPVHDLDGNMVANGFWTYSYDVENRLVAAYSNSVCIVSNAYDHSSRRVQKFTPSATYTFIYDGWNLIQETIQNQQSTITNHFVWGKDLSGTMQGAGGVGGLLAVQLDGTWYIPFYDANGNITAYVDESGTVVASYTYDAFGATIAQSGVLADAFPQRFSTKYHDAETGLYYYGYRFYSPLLHRWLNRDPLGERGGLNLYGFCNNNGVNQMDALGEAVLHEPDSNWFMQRFNIKAKYSLISVKTGNALQGALEQYLMGPNAYMTSIGEPVEWHELRSGATASLENKKCYSLIVVLEVLPTKLVAIVDTDDGYPPKTVIPDIHPLVSSSSSARPRGSYTLIGRSNNVKPPKELVDGIRHSYTRLWQYTSSNQSALELMTPFTNAGDPRPIPNILNISKGSDVGLTDQYFVAYVEIVPYKSGRLFSKTKLEKYDIWVQGEVFEPEMFVNTYANPEVFHASIEVR